ncbi:MAG: type II secretion system protein F [Actinobacteria bacterium]|nr:type II secretion system protein F [Actinomycetota bacterium]
MKRRLLSIALVVGAILAMAQPAFAQEATSAPTKTALLGAVLGLGAAVGLFVWILFGPNAAVERDLQRRLATYADSGGNSSIWARIPILGRFASSAQEAAESRGMTGMIETALEQADLPLRPGEAIVGMVGLSAAIAAIVAILKGSLFSGLIAGAFILLLAVGAVRSVASRQRRKFVNQLPDTLNLISTSLRAGYSLLQAVEVVGAEASEPTAREFSRAITETRLGRPPIEALKDVAKRMESVDFEWAVLAMNIQREVGGNLAEVLQTAAETMVQRNRLRREMKALTAEGRISAYVLGGLPFGLFFFLLATNRSYMEPLLTSTKGRLGLGGAVLLLLAGIAWLNKIVKVEI